jgi:hypothetical protein
MRSGIEGSSTESACSATLMLSCLTTEEERTIGEQHEELDAEILEHYEEGLERERLLFEGETQRLIVLEDVRGEPVTIVFASNASKFDKVWPEAQKVIDSVQLVDP